MTTDLINAGDTQGAEGITYSEYPESQIDAVVALLKNIVGSHHIPFGHILGHSDIAPHRKTDPGPKFPWKRLADEGLIPWPDPVAKAESWKAYQVSLPSLQWFQAKLIEHGFALSPTGVLDKETLDVLKAFQMKYRPQCFDGLPDAETAAILDVLTRAQGTE